MGEIAALNAAQRERVRNLLGRASARLDASERVAKLSEAQSGDYDNAFDGTVTAIYHILDAFELARMVVRVRRGGRRTNRLDCGRCRTGRGWGPDAERARAHPFERGTQHVRSRR